MRFHIWEDLGDADFGGEHRWICRGCGADTTSFDKPWVDRIDTMIVSITTITCGGGPAYTKILADCKQELVRQLMMS